MIKNIFQCLFISFSFVLTAQENKSLLNSLDKELGRQKIYTYQKHQQIQLLKQEVQLYYRKENPGKRFELFIDLFEEYESFKYDSAYFYLEKAKTTAGILKKPDLLEKVKMKEGFILLSSGLFKEAIEVLTDVSVSSLSPSDKYEYYFIKGRLYYDLADYNNGNRYRDSYVETGNNFIKEAKDYAKPNSKDFWAAEGLLQMKQNNWSKAEKAFQNLIKNFELSPELSAVVASSLSYIYSQIGDSEKTIKYLIAAAISDIKSATKENVALRNLAKELYAKGQLERANLYIHKALEDAKFYNARQRKMELSSVLPIIEGALLDQVEEKNSALQKTVILLALLALVVIIFLFIIFKQLKEKTAARKALREYNLKLQEMNKNLKESDAIKQDYITYFLKTTSQMFSKIGQLQASTTQKIKTKKPEEVLNVLEKYNINKEKNDLFHQFDEVFLKLFPSFIEEFNNLLPKEKRKLPKKNELLSKELRIFALYRLGINDSAQVAEFMNLSIDTIYSYKARLKSNSFNGKMFEKNIMKIKILQ